MTAERMLKTGGGPDSPSMQAQDWPLYDTPTCPWDYNIGIPVVAARRRRANVKKPKSNVWGRKQGPSVIQQSQRQQSSKGNDATESPQPYRPWENTGQPCKHAAKNTSRPSCLGTSLCLIRQPIFCRPLQAQTVGLILKDWSQWNEPTWNRLQSEQYSIDRE